MSAEDTTGFDFVGDEETRERVARHVLDGKPVIYGLRFPKGLAIDGHGAEVLVAHCEFRTDGAADFVVGLGLAHGREANGA